FQWNTTSPIRATLCWTDPPGPKQTGGLNDPTLRLINDLDITITSPDAVTTHYPWTLDPGNPADPATTGDNIRDNVEQIYITDPNQPGIYTLEISYKTALTDGEQHYSLLLSGQSLIPDEPTDLSAQTGFSCGQVLLTWTPSKGASGYNIYYREDLPGPPFVPIQDGFPPSGSDAGDVTSASITGLNSSKSYYFAVTAYSNDGESDFSTQASAQPSLPCTISISGLVTTVSGSAIENVAIGAGSGGDTDTTAPDGFYQVEIPYGWTGGVIIPSKPRWTFEPTGIFIPGPVLNNIANQNFTGKAWADLDFDNNVDMSDLAIISRYYSETTCTAPNWCDGSDLDLTGEVDIIDIRLAGEQWLDIK
ncbi:MAG: fibronectin type III domain-containing protein, partial [Planctomycetes bacterium]|nr:fibronectin type III domain-containing protein [Planctomycetota bacterium]